MKRTTRPMGRGRTPSASPVLRPWPRPSGSERTTSSGSLRVSVCGEHLSALTTAGSFQHDEDPVRGRGVRSLLFQIAPEGGEKAG